MVDQNGKELCVLLYIAPNEGGAVLGIPGYLYALDASIPE